MKGSFGRLGVAVFAVVLVAPMFAFAQLAPVSGSSLGACSFSNPQNPTISELQSCVQTLTQILTSLVAQIGALANRGTTPTSVYELPLSPSSGAVGTPVTISGSGFTSTGNTINFGNLTAGSYGSNGSTISFNIPRSLAPTCSPGNVCAQFIEAVTPGTYNVSVTNANGTSNVRTFQVTSGSPITIQTSTPVTGPTATVSLDAGSPAAGSIAMGTVSAPVMTFDITAGASEGINVQSIKINYSTNASFPQFANLTLWDGSEYAGPVALVDTSPYSATFYLSSPVYVPAGGGTALTIKADVPTTQTLPSIIGTSGYFSIPSGGVNVIGQSSGMAATATGSAYGSNLTITSGGTPISSAPSIVSGLCTTLSSSYGDTFVDVAGGVMSTGGTSHSVFGSLGVTAGANTTMNFYAYTTNSSANGYVGTAAAGSQSDTYFKSIGALVATVVSGANPSSPTSPYGGVIQSITSYAPGCANYTNTGSTAPTSTPSVTMTSPNGGEQWQVGQTYTITWSSANLPAGSELALQLQYETSAGAVYEDSIASGIYPSGNTGSWTWTVPAKYGSGMMSNAFKMRIIAAGQNLPSTNPVQSYSAAPFTIVPGVTTIAQHGALSITADPTSPAATQIAMGSSQNKLAAFRLTETSNVDPVSVNSLTVSDYTPSNKVAFSNLTLWNGQTLVGTATSVVASANGVVSYGFSFVNPVMVPQGNSITLTLQGDVPPWQYQGTGSDNSSHTFQIAGSSAVNAVDQTTRTPITPTVTNAAGNTMTVLRSTMSMTVGSLGQTSGRTLSTFDRLGTILFTANNAGGVVPGTLAITFSGSALINSPTFMQGVKLLDSNGIALPSPSINGDVATWNIGSNYMIGAGSSYGFELQANTTLLAGGANSGNISYGLTASIQNQANVTYADAFDSAATQGLMLPSNDFPETIIGVAYAPGTIGPGSGGTSTTPPSISASTNSAVGQQNVTANTPDVKIGSFTLKASSAEAVQVNSINILMNGNAPFYQNMKLMVNGSQFGQTQAVLANNNTYTFNGTPFTVSAGGSTVVDVYADIQSTDPTILAGTAIMLSGCTGQSVTSYTALSCTGVPAYGQYVNITAATVTPVSASLAFSAPSGSSFTVGQNWTLNLTSNVPNTSFTMCGSQNGVQSCTPNWGTTGSNGSWSGSGTFTSTSTGSWIEYAEFPIRSNATTNQISFSVAAAQPGTLSFSQNSFSASYTEGSALPSTLSNSPNLYTNTPYYQSLTFTDTASVPVTYTISVPNQPAWLNSGYATTQLTATPGSPTGIGAYLNPATVATAPGTYTTNIVITGNFVGSPKTIPVTLTVSPAASSGSPVTVTAPAGGENLTQGSTYTIHWNTTGGPSTVNLNLLQNSTYLYQIASGVPNNGSYTWTVPSNYSGSGFAVYISLVGYLPATSNAFSITAAPVTAATSTAPVTIVSPNGGTYAIGSVVPITWIAPGQTNANNSVGLNVYDAATQSKIVMGASVGNTVVNGQVTTGGTYNWTIPSTVPPGSYLAYASVSNGWAQSATPFTIVAATSTSEIQTANQTADILQSMKSLLQALSQMTQ